MINPLSDRSNVVYLSLKLQKGRKTIIPRWFPCGDSPPCLLMCWFPRWHPSLGFFMAMATPNISLRPLRPLRLLRYKESTTRQMFLNCSSSKTFCIAIALEQKSRDCEFCCIQRYWVSIKTATQEICKTYGPLMDKTWNIIKHDETLLILSISRYF